MSTRASSPILGRGIVARIIPRNITTGYGVFGTIANQYAAGRKGFPPETLDFILEGLAPNSTSTIDLGCGTGIATRQLARLGVPVIGCDPDSAMLEAALSSPHDGIGYVNASADDLPFSMGEFDLATAFSAFHWFATTPAFNEIARVLRSGARFAVVNKTELGDFSGQLRAVLSNYVDTPLPEPKVGYDPFQFLAAHGARDLSTFSVDVEEIFEPNQAMSFIHSHSAWNLVPDHNRNEASAEAIAWILDAVRRNGAFVRNIRVDAVRCEMPERQ